jgi:archaellum component FlaC
MSDVEGTMLAQTILIAVVLVTLLAGLFFNYKSASELKADIVRLDDKIGRLDGKIDGVQIDVRKQIEVVQADLRKQIDGIQVDVRDLRQQVNIVQADLRQFYHLTGKLDGRVEAIERRAA